VTEQLALEQVFRDGGAVDRHEPRGPAPALRVQRARDEFLARAALAQDHHRHVGRRDLLDHAADLEHRIVGGDQAFERRAHEIFGELAVLFFERVQAERAADDEPQHVRIERLLVEIVGAVRNRAHRVVAVGVARDHDDTRVRRQAQDFLERAHAFADAFGVGRQAEILQHHGRLEAPDLRQRFFAVRGHEHFVFVETPAQLFLQADVVFDHEQPRLILTLGGGFAHEATGRISEKRVPAPGWLSTSTSPPRLRANSRAWYAPIPIPLDPFVLWNG
jgi:hypothetical protein